MTVLEAHKKACDKANRAVALGGDFFTVFHRAISDMATQERHQENMSSSRPMVMNLGHHLNEVEIASRGTQGAD